jgi:hypothetical protein
MRNQFIERVAFVAFAAALNRGQAPTSTLAGIRNCCATVGRATRTLKGATAPAINASGIVNASGYQTTLAPGTIFVIFGSNMGPATLASAAAPIYPANLAGTSITFTPSGGRTPIQGMLVYTSAAQVAAFCPLRFLRGHTG